jgi:hypothetical protein
MRPGVGAVQCGVARARDVDAHSRDAKTHDVTKPSSAHRRVAARAAAMHAALRTRSVQRDTRASVGAVLQDVPGHLPPELLPRDQIETVMETGVDA